MAVKIRRRRRRERPKRERMASGGKHAAPAGISLKKESD